MAAASIRDVAERAGVSVGTASNVLNRPELVAPATRAKVNAAIVELGFVRNETARQLRTGGSRTLGLVVLDVANPFFTDVARGVEDAASESGLSVILCNSDEQSAKEDAYLELLEEQRVKGILITPADGVSARLDRLRRRGTPVVLLDRHASRNDQCSVSVNDTFGGDLAVSHLIDRGHRRIAFVGGPISITQVRDRLEGAVAAMRRATREAGDLIVLPTLGLNVAAGRSAAVDLLRLPKSRRPTAVFCANDLLALGLLQELTRQSVLVPDDVAIVGYDDIDFAAAAAVPLSSISQPRRQLGRAAAGLLIEETESDRRHRHQQLVFEPALMVRESSDIPRRTRARS